jgi:hypothetical protein
MGRSVFSGIWFVVSAMWTLSTSRQRLYLLTILINIFYLFSVVFMASVWELNCHTVYYWKRCNELNKYYYRKLLINTYGILKFPWLIHKVHNHIRISSSSRQNSWNLLSYCTHFL